MKKYLYISPTHNQEYLLIKQLTSTKSSFYLEFLAEYCALFLNEMKKNLSVLLRLTSLMLSKKINFVIPSLTRQVVCSLLKHFYLCINYFLYCLSFLLYHLFVVSLAIENLSVRGSQKSAEKSCRKFHLWFLYRCEPGFVIVIRAMWLYVFYSESRCETQRDKNETQIFYLYIFQDN